MASPAQPKKPRTDDQVVDHLREEKNATLEQLVQDAPEIARLYFSELASYPQFQVAEILRKGFEDFKTKVQREFAGSTEATLAKMYLCGRETEGSFHSPTLEQRITQQLVQSH